LFVATCQTAFLARSSPLPLVAVFTPAAGAALQGSASDVWQLAIGRAPTGVALRASTRAPRVGARVTLTATVGPAVTGTVAFVQDRGLAIPGCTAKVLSAGVATCTTSYARPALHEITAEYSGDANYQPSSSSSWLAAGAASRSTVRIRGASLRGLLGRSPVFAFTVSAGAPVKRVVVMLPLGLSFSGRTARAALVTNAGGKRLRRSARLQGRALVITLATPSKRIHVSLTAAVHPAESLAAKVRHHRVKALRITLDVMTARGQVASLVATLRV
jgi:hypothetical protein